MTTSNVERYERLAGYKTKKGQQVKDNIERYQASYWEIIQAGRTQDKIEENARRIYDMIERYKTSQLDIRQGKDMTYRLVGHKSRYKDDKLVSRTYNKIERFKTSQQDIRQYRVTCQAGRV